MNQLLQTFIHIALWRKGPQDLPASRRLATCVLLVYAGLSFIQARVYGLDLQTAALMIAIDVSMLTGWVWAVLAFFGRRQRFVQTATAVLGMGVLLSVIDIVVRALQSASGTAESLPASWVLLHFVLLALLLGRIFMHALDRGLMTGMALTLAIVYSTQGVAQLMLEKL